MPYMLEKNDKGETCVWKQGADGKPEGKTLGCHPTEDEAKAQLAALYANVEDAGRAVCIVASNSVGTITAGTIDVGNVPMVLPRGRSSDAMIFTRGYRADESLSSEPGSPIHFVCSTEGVKRDGLDLKADQWDLTNYRRAPVFLWCHDYLGQHLPLGRADARIEGRQLVADVTFDQTDVFALQVENKYRRGFLHGVSVGWNQRPDGTLDLLDISAISCGSDPDALIQQQARAYRALADELEGVTQPGSTAKVAELEAPPMAADRTRALCEVLTRLNLLLLEV